MRREMDGTEWGHVTGRLSSVAKILRAVEAGIRVE